MPLRIEKAVTDGLGLAHNDNGRIVLVEGVLPGELVEERIIEESRGTIRAEATRILEASPMRRAPFCPYYGKCGGCNFQIINEEDSAAIKEDIVKDNLLRIGHFDTLPPFDSPVYGSAERYRHRARFHVSIRTKDWGFMAKRTNEIVRIDDCPLLSEKLSLMLKDGNAIIAASRQAVFENRTSGGIAEVSAFEGDEEVSTGENSVCITVCGIPYMVSANVFFQSNPRLLPELFEYIKTHVVGNIIMDLYSGVGTFSALFEGDGKTVYAVERDKRCLMLSKKNAPSARSFTSDVGEWTKKSGVKPDTIIVDPPRTGMARDAISIISSFGAERIIYVSCNSVTASRDLALFEGYSLDRARVFDFYPGTGHEESAFILTRR